jgi:transposase
MSKKERERIAIMHNLTTGTMTITEASIALGISERHCRRLKASYLEKGDAALVHKLRGKPSNNGYSPAVKTTALTYVRRRYTDFGPTLLAETLEEQHDLRLSRETLRRWMLAEGLWQRVMKGRRHRKRRPRRSCIGELVQFDGSHHDWFEGRGAPCCLFVFIDDASSRSLFYFAETEDEHAALTVLLLYILRYGIPRALYLDRHAVYKSDGVVTQFARACAVLGIELIHARSPQAKGRVERANRTHQDRLVKKMRLAGIADIASANAFLEEEYIDEHNARFSCVEGLDDIHRDPAGLDLPNIICREEERTVRNDHTIQVRAQILSILPINDLRPLPHRKVIVRWWLDGSMHVFWKEKELHVAVAPERKTTGHIPSPPGPNHPWRKSSPIGRARLY